MRDRRRGESEGIVGWYLSYLEEDESVLFVICMKPTDRLPREHVGEVVRGVVGIGEE